MAEGKVAILDAGAQYGKVIDRRVRELFVQSDLFPLNVPANKLKKYQAIIISGGPQSVYAPNSPKCDPKIFSLGKPILGICYGMQLITFCEGGKVDQKNRREDGPCTIVVDENYLLFSGLKKHQQVLMSHGDSIIHLPKNFKLIAKSKNIFAAIADEKRKIYGVQFHPEVDLTINGQKIMENFLYKIANFTGNYRPEDKFKKAISDIRRKVKDKKVLVLVSGGVDSTVCAALLSQALPAKNIYALHIDSGFMRLNESKNVQKVLGKVGINLKVVNASSDFFSATTHINNVKTPPLEKVTNPEQKRKIIGDTFIKIAEREIKKFRLNPDEVFLVQGTLRPDLIESASKLASSHAEAIKTHHNDTELVRKLRETGKVIEPLQDLHKDEVRQLGKQLGLPKKLIERQPFPGPGLAVRIICADKPYVTKDFEKINQKLKSFNSENIKTTLLPIQTVGVQGDGRSYKYLVGLSGQKDWKKLFKKALEIPKKIHQVNRVVYIFGEQIRGPVTQITPTHLTLPVIHQLQKADQIVNSILIKYHLTGKLTQVPVILFPVSFGSYKKRSIAIRTFITRDFMTGLAAVPNQDFSEAILLEIVSEILKKVQGISRVVYDLTSKPPGTTEWE